MTSPMGINPDSAKVLNLEVLNPEVLNSEVLNAEVLNPRLLNHEETLKKEPRMRKGGGGI